MKKGIWTSTPLLLIINHIDDYLVDESPRRYATELEIKKLGISTPLELFNFKHQYFGRKK